MTKHAEFENGIYKVVPAEQLETLTTSGWQLVEILQTTAPVGLHTTVAAVPQWSGGPIEKQSVLNTVFGPQPQFLLRLGPEAVCAALTAERDKWKAQAEAVEQEQATLTQERDKLLRELEAERRAATNAAQYTDRLRSARDELQAQVRKMEDDIGKIRTEVGEGEMRRILGIDPKRA